MPGREDFISRESTFREGYSAIAVSISKLFNKHHSRLSEETSIGLGHHFKATQACMIRNNEDCNNN